MIEKRMVFFHAKRLAREFGMTTRVVAMLLHSLGMKKWSQGDGRGASVWYWEED